jgi:uncharacterized protein with PIN domain
MYLVELKFHGELKEVVGEFSDLLSFEDTNTLKDIVESIGVPHTEFGEVRVDGAKSDANFKVNFNCRIDVYPEPVPRAIGGKAKFICDVHLGTLSKYLRFLGFDTIYRNDYSDSEIVRVAVVEKRIILTKDRGILKRRIVEDGYLVRGIKPWEQLEEVLKVYNLRGKEKLFSRCSECNGIVVSVGKKDVWENLQPKTREYYHEFYRCQECGKIYWKGSHYDSLEKNMKKILKDTHC